MFSTSKGLRTGMVFGMLNKFLRFLSKNFAHNNTQMIFCWDGREGSSVRKSFSHEYKSRRDHTEDKYIFDQIDMLFHAMNYYGFQSIRSTDGYEADDVGYTVVEVAKKKFPNQSILVISEDKDWEQLISPTVHMWKPRNKVLVSKPLDYSFEIFHSFLGDSVDDVKVSKSGLSKAEVVEIALEFKTVDDLLKHMKKHPKHPMAERVLKTEKKLKRNSELVKLYFMDKVAKQVVFRRKGIDAKSLLQLLTQLEFSKKEEYLRL